MLIATSINPRTRLQHQYDCYRKWKSLGYQYLTFNSIEEAGELKGAGIDDEDIFIVDDDATAQKIHNFKAPRIKAVLDAIVHKVSPDFLILTNSDIFPNVHKRMELLPTIASCAAFTRREVFSVESCDFASIKQYRGGLDIFSFGAKQLEILWFLIKDDELAERMTFGVPGWDFYLGGLVLSETMRGKILDGSVFCHVSHLTTYRQIKEFEHYAEKMKNMGLVQSSGHQDAAAEFTTRIERECRLNHKLSITLHILYYEKLKIADSDVSKSTAEINVDNLLMADIFHKRSDARHLVSKVVSSEINIVAFKSYFCKSPSIEIQFMQLLCCLYFLISMRHKTGALRLTSKYPVGNAHKAAVSNCMKLVSILEARYYLLDILCDETIIYGIFNKNLLKAIALSCINDRERWLVAEISKQISEYSYARTA